MPSTQTDPRSDDGHKRPQQDDRSWVRDALAKLPPGAPSKTVLAALALAALAPVASPFVTMGGVTAVAVAAAGPPLRSLAGGLIGALLSNRLSSCLDHAVPLPTDEQDEAFCARLAEMLDERSPDSAQLRDEILQLLHETGTLREAVTEATERQRDDIVRGLAELVAGNDQLAGIAVEIRGQVNEAVVLSREQLVLLRQLNAQMIRLELAATPSATAVTAPPRAGGRGERPDNEGQAPDPQTGPPPPSPYVGLRSFTAQDADRFFGRDALVANLVSRYRTDGFVAVLGPSGSGKSSLIHAGLLPVLARPGGPEQTTPQALPAVLKPGRHPVESLAVLLAGLSGPATTSERVLASLRRDPANIRLVIAELLDRAETPPEMALVVDQFEEVFTHCDEPAQRTRFIQAVTAAATSDRCRVVLAIRSDFHGRLSAYPDLVPLLEDGSLTMAGMTEAELGVVIAEPALAAGVPVEDELIQLATSEVLGEPGGLPMLSHALQQTWVSSGGRAMTAASYIAAGGVHRAIEVTGDQCLAMLSDDDRRGARAVLLRLANQTTDLPTRLRMDLDELVTLGDGAFDVAAIIGHLADARLLTVSEDTVEVAHEAVLREWPTFRGWLREDRQRRDVREDISAQARRFDLSRDPDDLLRGARLSAAEQALPALRTELTRSELHFVDESLRAAELAAQAERRRTRRALAVAGIALVMALVAGVASAGLVSANRVANRERDKARSAEATAVARRLIAQSAVVEPQDPSLASLLAVEGSERLDSGETDRRLAELAMPGRPAHRGYSLEGDTESLWIIDENTVAVTEATPDPPGHRLVFREIDTGRATRSLPVASDYVLLSPDGSDLGYLEGNRYHHLGRDGTGTSVVELGGLVSADVFSPHGSAVLGTRSDGRQQVWFTATGAAAPGPNPRKPDLSHQQLSDSGQRLVYATPDREIGVAGPDGPLWSQVLPGQTIYAVRIDSTASVVAFATNLGILIYDAATGRPIATEAAKVLVDFAMVFSPDGGELILVNAGEISRWSTRTGIAMGPTVPTGLLSPQFIEVDQQAAVVALVSRDKRSVEILRFDSGASLFDGLSDDFAPTGVSRDGLVVARYLPTGAVEVRRDGRTETIRSATPALKTVALAVDPVGHLALATGSGNQARLIDLDRREVRQLSLAAGVETQEVVLSALFLPDGSGVVVSHGQLTAPANAGVTAFNLDGTVRWTIDRSPARLLALLAGLALSPSGTVFAVAELQATPDKRPAIKLYSVANGREAGTIDIGATERNYPMAVDLGDHTVAVAYIVGEIAVYDLDGQVLRSLRAPNGFVGGARITYNSGTDSLAAVSITGELTSWGPRSADPMLTTSLNRLPGNGGSLVGVQFDPDGVGLVVTDVNGLAERLPWGAPAWRAAACARAGRNLTPEERRTYLPAESEAQPTCPQYGT